MNIFDDILTQAKKAQAPEWGAPPEMSEAELQRRHQEAIDQGILRDEIPRMWKNGHLVPIGNWQTQGMMGNTVKSISEAKPLDAFFTNAIAKSAKEATTGADMRFRLARDYGMDVMDQSQAEFATLMEQSGMNAYGQLEQAAQNYAMPLSMPRQGVTGDESLDDLIASGQAYASIDGDGGPVQEQANPLDQSRFKMEQAGQAYTNYTPQTNPNPYYPQIEQALGQQNPYPQMGQPKANPWAVALSALFGVIAPQRAAEFASMPLQAGIQNAMQDYQQRETQFKVDQQNREDKIRFLYERADEFTKREYERIATELDQKKAEYTIAKDQYDTIQNQTQDAERNKQFYLGKFGTANSEEEIREYGRQGGLSKESIDKAVTEFRTNTEDEKANKALIRVNEATDNIRQYYAGLMDDVGEISGANEVEAERYRNAVAKRYKLDVNELPPVPSGKTIKLRTYEIKKAEFDANAPYLAKEAKAELAKKLADAELARTRADNYAKWEGQRIGISQMNANTSRYNALLRAADDAGNKANESLDKELVNLEQKLRGMLAAQKADANKLKHNPGIENIKAQMQFLESKKVPVSEPPTQSLNGPGFEANIPSFDNGKPVVRGPIPPGPKPTQKTPTPKKPKPIKTKGWTIEAE